MRRYADRLGISSGKQPDKAAVAFCILSDVAQHALVAEIVIAHMMKIPDIQGLGVEQAHSVHLAGLFYACWLFVGFLCTIGFGRVGFGAIVFVEHPGYPSA